MNENIKKMAIASLETERQAVTDVLEKMDWDAFHKAVDVLSHCDRIITSASGSSGIAARKMAHTLCCIERPAQFLAPCEALHGGMGSIQKGNAVIIVSRGGKTAELMPILDAALVKGATVIGVVENMESPLAKKSHIVLPMHVEKEADKYDMQATASFVATITLFDAMICGIMEETGYEKMQFALIHPGGAVGERLNK